jgi:hypothetical protein
MLYGIFDRGAWAGHRQALETEWRPYVHGERTLSDAALRLIETLRTAAGQPKVGGEQEEASPDAKEPSPART